MLKKLFIAFLPLGTIAVAIWLAWPEYQALARAKSERVDAGSSLDEKRQLITKIRSLEAQYHRVEGAADKVAQVVPPTPDVPDLLAEVPALVVQNGMGMNDISFTAEGNNGRSGEQVPYKIESVHLSLSGSYEALRLFLVALEKELRIMDVQSVQFSVPQGEGESLLKFIVTAQVYYGLES